MCITSWWSFKVFVPCSYIKVFFFFFFFFRCPKADCWMSVRVGGKNMSASHSTGSYSTMSKEQKLLSSSLLMHSHSWTQTHKMLYLSRWKFHLWKGFFRLAKPWICTFLWAIFSRMHPPAVAGFSDTTSKHGCFTLCLLNIRDPQCCSLWGESRLKSNTITYCFPFFKIQKWWRQREESFCALRPQSSNRQPSL